MRKTIVRIGKRISSKRKQKNLHKGIVGKNPDFAGISRAEYMKGLFAIHKNRDRQDIVDLVGTSDELDGKRVVGKGWQVVDGKKIEMLLFGDRTWDESLNWKRKRARGEGEPAMDGG